MQRNKIFVEIKKAAITFDKWHVIKLLYKHLDNLKATPIYDSLVLNVEKIESFFNNQKIEEAKAQLLFMADFANEIKPKNAFSKTIYRHFEGIVMNKWYFIKN